MYKNTFSLLWCLLINVQLGVYLLSRFISIIENTTCIQAKALIAPISFLDTPYPGLLCRIDRILIGKGQRLKNLSFSMLSQAFGPGWINGYRSSPYIWRPFLHPPTWQNYFWFVWKLDFSTWLLSCDCANFSSTCYIFHTIIPFSNINQPNFSHYNDSMSVTREEKGAKFLWHNLV